MAPTNFNSEHIAELCDKEFYYYISLSKGLIEHLKDRQDRQICVRWIRKLCRLQSNDPRVKAKRNDFFKFLLQIMLQDLIGMELQFNPNLCFSPRNDDTLNTIQNPRWLESQLVRHEKQKSRVIPIVRWSKDKRTYTAIKPLPGQGALIYMAVTKDPKQGWDNEDNFVA